MRKEIPLLTITQPNVNKWIRSMSLPMLHFTTKGRHQYKKTLKNQFFGPFSRGAFVVNKKSLFLQKCQCIEPIAVFKVLIYLPPLPPSDF